MATKGGGGSSQPNGPNSRAEAAAKAEGLSKSEQERMQRELEKTRENLSYKELREIARDVKSG